MIDCGCKSCGRKIVSNTLFMHKCAYDQLYPWNYHATSSNMLREGFLSLCCNCAKQKGWKGFAAHGCKQCKMRDETTEKKSALPSSEYDAETGLKQVPWPHPEPKAIKILDCQTPRPWLDRIEWY